MPHALGCQRALCWQPYVCLSCDGAGANLTFLSTALLQPQLQYPMPKLSRFRPLLPHVAMLKNSETPSQASTPLWLLCMAQTFIVPLHRQKRGRCRDSKSMFSVWHKQFPPASDSVTSNVQKCMSLCFSSIHPFQPPSHDYLHSCFSFLSGKT